MNEQDPFKRWIHLFNKGHGYSGVFNAGTDEEKAIVELSTTSEWVRSMEAEFGVSLSDPVPNPDDPPDCFVDLNDLRLGVELVQLVESDHIARANQGENPHEGQLFLDMQWSESRFLDKLKHTISEKGTKYAKRQIFIDVLLIHTAEPYLDAKQAGSWLANRMADVDPSFGNVFLLFDYDPSLGGKHWPLFCVYGDLGQQS